MLVQNSMDSQHFCFLGFCYSASSDLFTNYIIKPIVSKRQFTPQPCLRRLLLGKDMICSPKSADSKFFREIFSGNCPSKTGWTLGLSQDSSSLSFGQAVSGNTTFLDRQKLLGLFFYFEFFELITICFPNKLADEAELGCMITVKC